MAENFYNENQVLVLLYPAPVYCLSKYQRYSLEVRAVCVVSVLKQVMFQISLHKVITK